MAQTQALGPPGAGRPAEAFPGGEEARWAGADESVSEVVSKEVFCQYRCQVPLLRDGVPHPADIAEASSLGAIKLPETDYPLLESLPADVISEGKLSQLQLESVLHACAKHQTWLINGERAGFFIGDGAGVGKGRQIAGIVLDNIARGRRKHVWVSTSSDLHLDAKRDLRDIGCFCNVINGCHTLDREQRVLGLGKDFQEGVLFLTYSALISSARGHSRLDQVIDWVGGHEFSGCLIFDECHKAKNFVPGKSGKSTKASVHVIEIQKRLPRARIVYCSATGVSDVGNMAYMTRMGLWGPGTAFTDFEAFFDTMKKRGVSFLEMLAMEMKSEGKYVARALSFRHAEFQEVVSKLSEEQVAMYDGAVAFWQHLRKGLANALDLTLVGGADIWKLFWAAQQLFFKILCVSMKVPFVAKEARQALSQGSCVVIGLQSTGEAAADGLGLEAGVCCGFYSTAREQLLRFLRNHFPVKTESRKEGAMIIEPREIPLAIAERKKLVEQASALELPANFLDELIDKLGGARKVAEMTGRRGRVERDSSGQGVFVPRGKQDSSELDSLNVREKEAFMRGDKLIAIISDAASTGISLHASKECKNQRRRVHITIELPWSADKAIQQLGRTHRSNQTSAPIYKLVSTNVGGERRFVAAIARRLQSLGALTRGDRRAASGIDLSESNFDSPWGRSSLRRIYDLVVQSSGSLPNGVALPQLLEGVEGLGWEDVEGGSLGPSARIENLHWRLRDCIDMMGIGINMPRGDHAAEDKGSASISAKDVGDVRRFLNRLLGIPVAQQSLLFNYFATTLTTEITMAKAEGRYSEGFSDLPGSKIARAAPGRPMWVDPLSGLATIQNELTIDRGMTFEAAAKILGLERAAADDSGFRRSRRPMFGRTMHLLAVQKPGHRNVFKVFRPNTGESYFDMERGELEGKYEQCDGEEAQEDWDRVYKSSLTSCVHGLACTRGPTCQVGRRVTRVTILSGSVVRVWGALEGVLMRHELSLSRSDRTMRVVRVCLEGEENLVGVRYPAQLLPENVAILTSMQAQQEQALKDRRELSAAAGSSPACAEAVTPVDRKSLAKALQRPRTVLDYFKKQGAAGHSREPLGDCQQQWCSSEDSPAAQGTKRMKMSSSGEGDVLQREKLDTLVGMGFDEKRSLAALKRTGGDVQMAVNWMC